MSNITPSSPTPPKGPQELSPEKSIAAKQGFKRVVETDEAKTTTTSRVGEPQGNESTIKEEKSIADRSIASNEVPQKQTTEVQDLDVGTIKDQLLTDDVLGLVAKFSGVTDLAAMNQLSKSLNEISKNTDLEKLKQFSENNQLSFKDNLALSILILAAQTASKPSIYEITERAEVDTHRTPEEALNQLTTLVQNFNAVKTATNDLMQSAAAFYPPILDYAKWAAGLSTTACLAVYAEAEGSAYIPIVAKIAIAILTVSAANEQYQLGTVGAFRAAATGILTTLTQKLNL